MPVPHVTEFREIKQPQSSIFRGLAGFRGKLDNAGAISGLGCRSVRSGTPIALVGNHVGSAPTRRVALHSILVQEG